MVAAFTELLASVIVAFSTAPATTVFELPPLTVTRVADGADTATFEPLTTSASSAPEVTVVLLPVTVRVVASGTVTTELDPEIVTSVQTPVTVTVSTDWSTVIAPPAQSTTTSAWAGAATPVRAARGRRAVVTARPTRRVRMLEPFMVGMSGADLPIAVRPKRADDGRAMLGR